MHICLNTFCANNFLCGQAVPLRSRLQICALYFFYPWISTSISSHSEYETVKEGTELGSKSQENLQCKTLSKTHGTGQESSLALLHLRQWGRSWAAVNSPTTARSTGAASISITWPNSLLQICNISPALEGFLLIYTPRVSKQSQGLSSPIRSAPQLYLPNATSSNSKHRATAESGHEEAGGAEFYDWCFIGIIFKKRKAFRIFHRGISCANLIWILFLLNSYVIYVLQYIKHTIGQLWTSLLKQLGLLLTSPTAQVLAQILSASPYISGYLLARFPYISFIVTRIQLLGRSHR